MTKQAFRSLERLMTSEYEKTRAQHPCDCYECGIGWCTEAWDVSGQRPKDCPFGDYEEDSNGS